MADLEEIKGLFSDTQKTLTALRSDVEDLKGKSADYIDTDRQEKMKADLAQKFEAEQKALAERLEAVETKANRPGGAGKETKSEYEVAFGAYMRKGNNEDEIKAMATTPQADGGVLVTDVMEAGIRKRNWRTSPIRQVANVVSGFAGASYDILIDRDEAGYEWGGEKTAPNATGTPTIDRISITLHELSALPKISQRLLDNSSYDVEAYLAERVADKFGRAEATAFVSGDGVNKPKGFLSYSKATDADSARAVETLQYRATGASGAFNGTDPADVLRKTYYDLQAVYQANATWMMKNTTMAEVAVLQDGQGAYLVREMMNSDGAMLRTIEGRPVVMADDMPAIAANSYSIALGDFSAGYTIVDGHGIRVLRDPFSAKPHVLFYTTKAVGGGLVEADAIKLIKFGTS